MDKSQWTAITEQLKPHLEAIQKIAEENEIGMLNIAVDSDEYYSAFCIDSGFVYSFSSVNGASVSEMIIQRTEEVE
jgi:hypothetical protein